MSAKIVLAHVSGGRFTSYGGGPVALIALDTEYVRDGEPRMRELHNIISKLTVTVKDRYDTDSPIRTIRRIHIVNWTCLDIVIIPRRAYTNQDTV